MQLLDIPRKVGFSKIGVKFIYLRKKKNCELLWSNIESKDGRPYFDTKTQYYAGPTPASSTSWFLHLRDGKKFYLPYLSTEILKRFENQYIEIDQK